MCSRIFIIYLLFFKIYWHTSIPLKDDFLCYKTTLNSSSISGVKSTYQPLLFFFYNIIYCCWGVLYQKRGICISWLLFGAYISLCLFTGFQDIFWYQGRILIWKMAISNNRQTRLLEVITYHLNYLNYGFSLQASFFVFCVVRFTVSLSSTSILL